MSDESRNAFEDWATHCDYPFEFTTYDDGEYCETDTYIAYIAWKFRSAEIAAKDARIAQLEAAVTAVAQLIDESNGVDGLHLNGDVASWDSLLEGGRYEEWLIDFSEALK